MWRLPASSVVFWYGFGWVKASVALCLAVGAAWYYPGTDTVIISSFTPQIFCRSQMKRHRIVYDQLLHLLGNGGKLKQSNYTPGQSQSVPGGRGSQISRQSAHEDGKVVSPTHRPPLPPRKYSWYSFLLEAESTPGPQCGRKDYVNEKFQWHHRESNLRPSGL